METQTLPRPTRLDVEETFQDAVLTGLLSDPKTLPSKFLYDELGSQLFEAICFLPEYYLTRAETELLEANADDIVAPLDPGCRLVELGAGSAIKTRVLIRAMLANRRSLVYIPIDISEEAMRIAQANIVSEFSGCRVEGVIGDWIGSLARMRENDTTQRLILFLGSSIGNLEEDAAISFLGAVRERMGPTDKLLLGADLAKDPDVLIAAYDDPLGVTAAFNRNILVRINQELGGGFDPRSFDHEARWDPASSRIEMHLVSRIDQDVPIRSLERTFRFQKGESIHTENSHKYDPTRLAAMLDASGLRTEESWSDPGERFALYLIGAKGD